MENQNGQCIKHEEDIKDIKNDTKNINDKLDNILSLLNGNGKIGFIAKCQLSYDWMMEKKKDRHDLVMIGYRFVLITVLGFIAVKLGIK